MDRGVDVPWLGGQNTMDRGGRYICTMGRGPQQEIPNISSENRVWSIQTFPNEKKNIFVKKQRILMNFHIFSAYNSEISSEFQEKIRNCPNTPNELGKKFGIPN